MKETYQCDIGLEIHVELKTESKLFCGCSTAFGGVPNSHTCPVCTGQPGTLPVLNRKVLEYAMLSGLACNCTITPVTRFDRKNYFYPDNPQNYQISQLYAPIARNGWVEILAAEQPRRVGIHEIHMEEDAGKLIHDETQPLSYIDYNRAGVPLIEIVTEPDMKNAEEVIACLEKLRLLLCYLMVSDCKLNEGSMRADVNLSVRRSGETALGVRTEMKNLNSFHEITHAIHAEKERQIALLKAGGEIVLETRRWDEAKGQSFSMRSKEDSRDYRYFPEPDLPPVVIEKEEVERLRNAMPEFREERILRYQKEYGLPTYDAGVLTAARGMADFFETAASLSGNAKKVSNWLMGETLRLQKEKGMEQDEIPFSAAHLVKLIALSESGRINSTVAKEAFLHMFEEDLDPECFVEEAGLGLISDEKALEEIIDRVMAEQPKSVADYRNGKKQAAGFLIGQIMRQTAGKADPAAAKRLLAKKLEE